MEQMIGQTSIAPDSPLRAAAAHNLEAHLATMIAATKAAGAVPIVCTTATNESGLAPLGESAAAAERFAAAQALAAAGDARGAREAFLDARDLDPMPWRPTRGTEEAIRAAARSVDAPLCDIAAAFRDASPAGATGWELLDDHVHLTVRGQADAARLMADTILRSGGPLAGDAARVANRVELDRIIADFIGARSTQENLDLFEAAGVTVGPVCSMADLLDHPYTNGREAIVRLEDGDMGSLPMHNIVPRLTGSPGGFRRPAPALGEHTAEINAELSRLP
jgi:hypothetical protein